MGGKGGGGSATADVIDPSTWRPEERAFVEATPGVEAAYRAGSFTQNPDYYMNDVAIRTSREGQLSDQLGFNKAGYDAFFPEWEASEVTRLADEQAAVQAKIDERNAALAAGTPEFMLDPTPETELTTEDQMTQMQMQMQAMLADQQEADMLAQQEAENFALQQQQAEEAEVARLANEQREYDQTRLSELWDLRSQSEDLAIQDIQNYITDAQQQGALRGVKTTFDDEQVADLTARRFGEYWSGENETSFATLAGTYGAPGDLRLQRVEGTTDIGENQTLVSSASPYVNTVSDTIFSGLLVDEEETDLITSNLLGA